MLTRWLNLSFKAWEKITTQCVWCIWQKQEKINFFLATEVSIFWGWWFKISASHICLFCPSIPTVLLHQWASFKLLYALSAAMYKCIYPALGETASSCFILTWTLNLSLYIVCITELWLTFSPSGPFVMKKIRDWQAFWAQLWVYILQPALPSLYPLCGMASDLSGNPTGAKGDC